MPGSDREFAWVVQSVRWSMRAGRAAEGGRNGEVPLAQPSAKEGGKLRCSCVQFVNK
jgi:hypothetical protein